MKATVNQTSGWEDKRWGNSLHTSKCIRDIMLILTLNSWLFLPPHILPQYSGITHTLLKTQGGQWPIGIIFSLNTGQCLGYDHKGQLYITLKTNLERKPAVVNERLEFILKATTRLMLTFSANTVRRQYTILRPAESIFSFSCFYFIYLFIYCFYIYFFQFFYKSSGKTLDHKHTVTDLFYVF